MQYFCSVFEVSYREDSLVITVLQQIDIRLCSDRSDLLFRIKLIYYFRFTEQHFLRYLQIYITIDTYRIHVALDKCVAVLVSSFYHPAFNTECPGIIAVFFNCIVPR